MTASHEPYPVTRLIGILNVVVGLGHAGAPWILGYADVTRAAISSAITGLIIAACGLYRAIAAPFGWAWTSYLVILSGFWVLAAPQALAFSGRNFAPNEAVWSGFAAILLGFCALIAIWFDHPARSLVGRS
jgi:hypothetical protein